MFFCEKNLSLINTMQDSSKSFLIRDLLSDLIDTSHRNEGNWSFIDEKKTTQICSSFWVSSSDWGTYLENVHLPSSILRSYNICQRKTRSYSTNFIWLATPRDLLFTLTIQSITIISGAMNDLRGGRILIRRSMKWTRA